MTRPALVLRPEPGGGATAGRLQAAGLPVIRLPLFAISPVTWAVPRGDFDALLLTSANAVRHAGSALAALRTLPVVAVGKGTAAAARAAGLTVAAAGTGDGEEALALARENGWRRLLRLAGRDRTQLAGVTDVAVYASDPIVPPAGALAVARGAVALLHSRRAAALFRDLVERDAIAPAAVRLAAISRAVADAAGGGWDRIIVAPRPSDDDLIEAVRMLAIDP